jgi:hypothetical protein
MPFADYALNENRYRMLKMMNPTHADELMAMSQNDVDKAWKFLNGRAQALELNKKGRQEILPPFFIAYIVSLSLISVPLLWPSLP